MKTANDQYFCSSMGMTGLLKAKQHMSEFAYWLACVCVTVFRGSWSDLVTVTGWRDLRWTSSAVIGSCQRRHLTSLPGSCHWVGVGGSTDTAARRAAGSSACQARRSIASHNPSPHTQSPIMIAFVLRVWTVSAWQPLSQSEQFQWLCIPTSDILTACNQTFC